MAFVLDSSVILANLNKEPGGERLHDFLQSASISVATYVEVVTRMLDTGMPFKEAERSLTAFLLPTVDVSLPIAKRAAELRDTTRTRGLSMGDRICLATAESLDATAVTADRNWAELDIGIRVELIR